jgi:hypothetical protein
MYSADGTFSTLPKLAMNMRWILGILRDGPMTCCQFV